MSTEYGHKKDIIIGGARIMYEKKKRLWAIHGGTFVDEATAREYAIFLNKTFFM